MLFVFWNSSPLFYSSSWQLTVKKITTTCVCNSILDMLKHKFTSYTNTNLRTVIKYLKCNKTWVFFFLLSHLIQLLLLCSVLLLNKALFVRQSVHPYSAIFTVGRFVVCGRSCIIFSKQAGRLSHLPLAGACSTGKIYPLRI